MGEGFILHLIYRQTFIRPTYAKSFLGGSHAEKFLLLCQVKSMNESIILNDQNLVLVGENDQKGVLDVVLPRKIIEPTLFLDL